MNQVSAEEFLNLDAAGMAGKEVVVEGKTLCIPIPIIRVGAGFLQQIPQIVEDVLGHPPRNAVILFDEAIRDFITENVWQPLARAGMDLTEFPLVSADPAHYLVASDAVGDAGAAALPKEVDFIVGTGSGVIGDLTKWIATKRDIPFVIIGTAASMNGHASITGAMSFGDIKETAYDLKVAEAVIYDTEILAKAPLEMNLSGFSDMLARNTCNADWKLSSLVRGIENFLALPYDMMTKTQDLSFKHAAQIPKGDPAAVAALGEACLISGMTMTILRGHTSPSSGVEHIISHFWDLLGDINGKDHFWHGSQVGVGVLLGLALYDMVEALDPRTIDPHNLLAKRRSWDEIESYLKAAYPGQWEYFLETAKNKTIKDHDYVAYVSDILANWYPLWTELKPYRSPFKLIQHSMKAAGAATTLAEVHQTKDTAVLALLDGNFYRPRYTILDLAWELGIFPARVEEVLERAEVL